MAESPQSKNEPGWQLGRLFAVPLIIVGVIIGCAVVVVLAFGAIVSFKEVPVDQLLTQLESASGERRAGVLMPRDKELWQAGQELAFRLDNRDREIAPDDLPELQRRLTALLERDMTALPEQHDTVRQLVYFTMHAAAKSGAPGAVPLLVERAVGADNEVQREALRALAWMGDVPEARVSASQLIPLLEDDSDVVRLFACLVLANLGTRENSAVLEALLAASRRIDGNPEVRWNAVLALARFGYTDADGWVAQQLCDLLSRDFWQERRVRYTPSDDSRVAEVDRPFTEPEIENRLVAALEAAENLESRQLAAEYAGQSLRGCVDALKEDASLRVANHARQVLAGEKAVGETGASAPSTDGS